MTIQEQINFVDAMMESQNDSYFETKKTATYEEYDAAMKALKEIRRSLYKLSEIQKMVS